MPRGIVVLLARRCSPAAPWTPATPDQMRLGIRAVDSAFAVWTLAWLVAAGAVYTSPSSSRTAAPLSSRRATASSRRATGCGGGQRPARDGGRLGLLGDLPFVAGDPGNGVEQTADDVDRFAVGVRAAGRDARVTGADAQEAAGTLALVLGLAVALGPTVPAAFLYLLLRLLLGEQLRRA